jgi:hypothetical protein
VEAVESGGRLVAHWRESVVDAALTGPVGGKRVRVSTRKFSLTRSLGSRLRPLRHGATSPALF